MKTNNEFLIPFLGLKQGNHQFEYQINKAFFDSFSFEEFEQCAIIAKVVVHKKPTLLELHFSHKGTVNVPCDLTGENFDLPVKGKLDLIVKFGDEYNNDNDELLILPHGEHQIDVAQYLYEMIVLSVPQKRIHPGVKDGSLQSDVLEKLKQIEPKTENKKEETDPRWDKLKQLLTDK